MNRRLFGAMLLAAGIVLGVTLDHYGRIAIPPAAAQEGSTNAGENLAEQFKDLRTQVKEINTLLHSGELRVVVVVNPDDRSGD